MLLKKIVLLVSATIVFKEFLIMEFKNAVSLSKVS